MTQTVELDDLMTEMNSALQSHSYVETLEETADDLRVIHQNYFDTESGPDGSDWVKWYYRRPGSNPQHKTLQDTGRLMESLQDGPDHVEQIADNTLTWGTSVPYAYQHQFGGDFTVDDLLIGKRKERKFPGDTITLPQREFVGINSEHIDKIVDKVADSAMQVVLAVIDGKG